MKNRLFILLLILLPLFGQSQSLAWKRSLSIGKGMNLTWLDQRWNGTEAMAHRDYINIEDLPKYKEQVKLMHEMGYQFLRLPVCFDLWYSDREPYALLKPQYFFILDSVVKWTTDYKMMLSIDYHHGKLRSNNLESDVNRISEIWKDVAAQYKKTNPDQVFFEIFNEPFEVNEEEWQESAKKIIQSIRSVDQTHTLIVGGTKWNGLDALLEMPLLPDGNIIYTFHFYDPFLFTHQGASWSGDAASTVGLPYPYNSKRMPLISEKASSTWAYNAFLKYPEDANYRALYNRIKTIKDWSIKNHQPIFCGEWGAYNKYAEVNDRCEYLKNIYTILDTLTIPNAMWEWKDGFSYFDGTPSIDHVSPCFKEAMQLK